MTPRGGHNQPARTEPRFRSMPRFSPFRWRIASRRRRGGAHLSVAQGRVWFPASTSMPTYRAVGVLRHCCPWGQVRYNASAIGLAARSIATKSPCDGKLCRRPQVLLRSFCFRATLSAPAVQSGCPRLVACSAAWTAIREATDGSHLSPPERAPRRSTDPRGVSLCHTYPHM